MPSPQLQCSVIVVVQGTVRVRDQDLGAVLAELGLEAGEPGKSKHRVLRMRENQADKAGGPGLGREWSQDSKHRGRLSEATDR